MGRAKNTIFGVAIIASVTDPVLAHESHTMGFAWGSLIVPLGITTLALLLLAGSAGIFMRRKPKLLLKWHKRLAIATLTAALCHAAVVFLFHFEGEIEEEIAMQERTGIVTMKGNPLTLLGEEIKVGDAAPDFLVLDNDLAPVRLSSFRGKVCVIASVPSLDTPVCDLETRRFNEEATRLGPELVMLTISMDLPFAQKRWCGAAGVTGVRTLSDHRDASFGTSYGVLIKELRLLARAVFVVDREGTVQYVELVNEITNEPDYEAALSAVGRVM